MSNTSGLEPLGRAVLTKAFRVAKKDGMIYIPPSVEDREITLDTKVEVIAIGPSAWPDEPQRARVGDVVLVARMSGYMAKGDDGENYRFVNDRDIFAKVTNHE